MVCNVEMGYIFKEIGYIFNKTFKKINMWKNIFHVKDMSQYKTTIDEIKKMKKGRTV